MLAVDVFAASTRRSPRAEEHRQVSTINEAVAVDVTVAGAASTARNSESASGWAAEGEDLGATHRTVIVEITAEPRFSGFAVVVGKDHCSMYPE